MKRFAAFLFALSSYVFGLGAIAYYADFFVGYGIEKSVNKGAPTGLAYSLVNNLFLLLLFSLPHSLMARPEVKSKMRQVIPFALERSVYILISSALIFALCYFWRPIPEPIFDVRGTSLEPLVWTMYGIGWFFAVFSSFLIDHFDLFGLKQGWNFKNSASLLSQKFVAPFFYKLVRHPIYLGWLMVHWFNPYFSIGQCMMAVFMTLYMFIAMNYEERDLTIAFGEQYTQYKRSTPKIIPLLKRGVNS